MLPLVAFAWSGCSSEGEGRPDSELGNLVISPYAKVHKVDMDKATTEAGALLTAVLAPHEWIGESLGAHVVRGSSSVEVREGREVREQLDDSLFIDFDGEDRYVATLDNSNEYGRHAIFDGSKLYLRPRFGLYNGRAPQTETEAVDIRTEMAAGAGEYLALLAKGLEVSDGGAKTRGGRAIQEIRLQLAPTPPATTAETLGHRLWRNSIEVKTLSGQVDLDAETRVPLFITFEGSIVFTREARSFQMFVKAERSLDEIGHTRAVQAPPPDEVLTIGIRKRELYERNTLLKNIAPPARQAPTPGGSQGALQ
ncbi:MAG: hypothetical protein GY811_12130 [Myxococcales bacterium]|nr:hypothetical protein [Myxococcales bacterium]